MAKLITPRNMIEQKDVDLLLDRLVLHKELNLPADLDDGILYNRLLDEGRQALFGGNPIDEFFDFMKDPDYFYFTCKWLFNVDLSFFQCLVLKELWIRKFPMLIATRGFGKSFILSIYAMLRAIFDQGSKIIVVGAAFRQSKLLFEYMETVWRQSPILRHMVGSNKNQGPKRDIDMCRFFIGESVISAIPIGDGQKIRGMRANYTITDEFSSIPQDVYEVVIRGFSSVASNPVFKARSRMRADIMRSMGFLTEEDEYLDDAGFGNQSIISGTAYFSFNHFYDYWVRYTKIINSMGSRQALEEVFQGEVPENFNWKNYSVMRIPWTMLPKLYMDEDQVTQARATVHSALHDMEYGAVFARDTDGFFKRSLIESCVTSDPITLPGGESVQFSAALRGVPNVQYVYGIDPASESDNFAVIVLEVHPTHRRIVYSWTVTRSKMRAKLREKGIQGDTQPFYTYCAKKIRSLMKVFPTNHIGMDAQGGGVHVMEALRDISYLEEDEKPISILPYRVVDPGTDPFWWEDKEKPTDAEQGRHVIHLVQFANAKFTREANHGLKKDFEDKTILLPRFDTVTIGESIELDKMQGRTHNTLEDCVLEIEDLKDELAIIEHTQTPNGNDKWDTPEVKSATGKKGRQRKDRYSALVIGNMVARTMDVSYNIVGPPIVAGGFIDSFTSQEEGPMIVAPGHIVPELNDLTGMSVLH